MHQKGWQYNGSTYTDGGIYSRVHIDVHLQYVCGVGEGGGWYRRHVAGDIIQQSDHPPWSAGSVSCVWYAVDDADDDRVVDGACDADDGRAGGGADDADDDSFKGGADTGVFISGGADGADDDCVGCDAGDVSRICFKL